jgi:hypothetical protein
MYSGTRFANEVPWLADGVGGSVEKFVRKASWHPSNWEKRLSDPLGCDVYTRLPMAGSCGKAKATHSAS